MDQDGSGTHLELDLEHYIIPAPSASDTSYAANKTETPLFQIGNLWNSDIPFFTTDDSTGAINSSSFTIDTANYIKVVQTSRQIIFHYYSSSA
jgi:hypothetical protein